MKALGLSLAALGLVVGGALTVTGNENVEAQRRVKKKAKKVELKSYKSTVGIAGKITVIGSDTLLNLMKGWKEDFNGFYKNVSFDIEGKGSSTAPPALEDGRSDLGPMSRTMKESEEKKFVDKFGYKPTAVPVALDALAVFVNKDNPIKSLDLQQVDAIFSQTRKHGAKEAITKWGEVGVDTGNWANKNISMYGRNPASGTYAYFKKVALKKGDYSSKVNQMPGSAGVVQKISKESGAIGYSGLGYSSAGVKAIAIASGPNAKAYEATGENCLTKKYPLGRFLYIYVNKKPKEPIKPHLREFLKYILSTQGQKVVSNEGFVPLTGDLAAKARTSFID